jgi:hypothetical protein
MFIIFLGQKFHVLRFPCPKFRHLNLPYPKIMLVFSMLKKLIRLNSLSTKIYFIQNFLPTGWDKKTSARFKRKFHLVPPVVRIFALGPSEIFV